VAAKGGFMGLRGDSERETQRRTARFGGARNFSKRRAAPCVLMAMRLASASGYGHLSTVNWSVDLTLLDLTTTAPRAMEQETAHDWTPLLDRVRSGDESAGRELVEALWPQVAGRIAGLCPRRDEIEDLAQEVFLKVFTCLRQYRGGSFRAWIDVMTRRVCYDALRKQRVRPEWRFSDLPDFETGSLVDGRAAPGGDDAGSILAALFAKLPAEQAWLLKLVELDERAIGEVSREMGWTEVAGRLRLLRARRQLKKAYASWNEEVDP